MNKHRILFQCAPFCYGPTATSLAIAEAIPPESSEMIWLATGSSLELLAADERSHSVIETGPEPDATNDSLKEIVRTADTIVVNTDPDFASYALKLNPNVVYIDILHWMWDTLPECAYQAEAYIYEQFLTTDRQIDRIELPPKSCSVGPLVPRLTRRAAIAPDVLVSVGGLFSPDPARASLLTAYEQTVRRAILSAVESSHHIENVYYVGGGVKQSRLELQNGTLVLFGTIGKKKYEEILQRCKAVVLSPGLTGMYEADSVGLPAFFLPPHNYSQYLQLDAVAPFLKGWSFCDWRDLGVNCRLRPYARESEALHHVDNALEAVVTKTKQIAERTERFLNKTMARAESTGLRRAFSTLSESGPENAADVILNLARRRRT